MPAAITHYFHGKHVAAEAGIKTDEAFTLGCQGPDFLFCHRFFPWQHGEKIADFGDFLHSTPTEVLFERMQAFVNEHDSPVLHSYFCGFLCHYALDRNCHPYINALAERLCRQEPGQTEIIFHHEIESALDTIILRTETGKRPAQFPLQKTVYAGKETLAAVAPLFVHLAASYGKKYSDSLVRQAFTDAYATFHALHDPWGWEYGLIHGSEKKGPRTLSCHFRIAKENPAVDYMNLSRTPWKDPFTGKAGDETFSRLFENATKDAAHLIAVFESKQPLSPLCDRSF